MLFDGKAEAEEDIASDAKPRKAEVAKARERLVVPPDAEVVAKARQALHEQVARRRPLVHEDGKNRIFDFGEWKTPVASRKNDHGTTTMYTITPGMDGFEFVVFRARRQARARPARQPARVRVPRSVVTSRTKPAADDPRASGDVRVA